MCLLLSRRRSASPRVAASSLALVLAPVHGIPSLPLRPDVPHAAMLGPGQGSVLAGCAPDIAHLALRIARLAHRAGLAARRHGVLSSSRSALLSTRSSPGGLLCSAVH